MWQWIKKHKGITILACAALIGVGGFFYIRHAAQEAMAALAEMSEETAFVERRSIQSSISSTGHIMSDSTKAVTATVTGLEVLTVHVEVGDIVQAGDVICTFDTADIEEGLSEAEDILSAAEVQSDVTVNNAKRGLEMAVETQNYQIEAAARAVLNAHNAWEAASDAYDDLKKQMSNEDVSSANAALKEVENEYLDSAEYKAVSTAQATLKTAQDTLATCTEDYNTEKQILDEMLENDPDADVTEQQDAVNTAQAEMDAAQAAVNGAVISLSLAQDALANSEIQKRYNAAQSELTRRQTATSTLNSSLATAENSLRQARIAYDNAVSTYDYTVASYGSQYEGSEDALRSARASAGVATISQENAVENYQEQLEKGVLKAGIPGTITAVNVEEGDIYAGGPVVTIQDTAELVVSAEIDEYDIADVQLGMKAVFKTDSTRDEQLEGRVIFISPTPTQGSDVTYQVKVAIDSDKARLRIGMNAKLNIILQETGDVLTVPYDAVQQDDAGNDVVYTVEHSEDGTVTKTAIPVTVGVEGDYYVEVSGNIAEGMEVSMPSDEVDFMARMEEMRENMMG